MSIALMTLAFKTSLPPTQKFVLVALSDWANDQGECYPSVPALAEKCSLSERAVQAAVSALEALRCIRREFRKGRSTVYWIDPTPAIAAPRPRSTFTPAADAPPQLLHHTPAAPAPGGESPAPPPPQLLHHTPAAPAPITVTDTSIEPSLKRQKTPRVSVDASLLIAAGFDPSTAAEFIATKVERKAPLTARAWADHCREAAAAGWTPQQAAEKVMAKTWKGFEAKYVANERQPTTPKHSGFASKNYREGVSEDGTFA